MTKITTTLGRASLSLTLSLCTTSRIEGPIFLHTIRSLCKGTSFPYELSSSTGKKAVFFCFYLPFVPLPILTTLYTLLTSLFSLRICSDQGGYDSSPSSNDRSNSCSKRDKACLHHKTHTPHRFNHRKQKINHRIPWKVVTSFSSGKLMSALIFLDAGLRAKLRSGRKKLRSC